MKPQLSSSGDQYAEGDGIAVRLDERYWAPGLIARSAPWGRVLLGYFFGPATERGPKLDELQALRATDATLVARFGDLALIEGSWAVLGRHPGWNRSEWPTPDFGRPAALGEGYFRVRYPDTNPNGPVREERISREEFARLNRDGLYGAVALERALRDALLPTGQRIDA